MATTALALPLLATTTSSRTERVVSEAWNIVDQRTSGRQDVIVASDANITLVGGTNRTSDTAWALLRVVDPSTLLSTTRTLTFPASPVGLWIVDNTTAQSLSVTCTGGATSTTVAAGDAAEFFGDGTEMVPMGDSSSGSGAITPDSYYSIKFSFMGQPDPLIECLRFTSVRNLTLPAAATNSAATAADVATVDSAFSLFAGNDKIAVITFLAGTAAATITEVVETTLVPSTVLSLRAPPVKDATLDNMGFALAFLKV